ncbi:MAG: DUF2127 domain-containing protein [Rhodoferax sp.]|nr:DUF2127 domain-containing protein [Rhodoferax sp.]
MWSVTPYLFLRRSRAWPPSRPARAYALVGHFHWNPQAQYPRLLLADTELLASTGVRQVVLLLWAYAVIRLIKDYAVCGKTAPGQVGLLQCLARCTCPQN